MLLDGWVTATDLLRLGMHNKYKLPSSKNTQHWRQLCWTFSDPGSVFHITNVYLTVTENFWHMIQFSYDQEMLKLLSWHRFSLITVVHNCGNFVLNLTLYWESFCYYEWSYNCNIWFMAEKIQLCFWKSPHPILWFMLLFYHHHLCHIALFFLHHL
jgi:hypothetical protein